MYKHISSLQNPVIKRLFQLQEKSRVRRKEGVFIVEGIRETELAIKGGFNIQEIYFNTKLFPAEGLPKMLVNLKKQPEITEISPEVYEKLAYRGSTEGLIAVVE